MELVTKISILLTILVSGTLAFASESKTNTHWDSYKSLHGKRYRASEDESRRLIWQESMDLVERHNLEAAEGKHNYTLAMNEFADLTDEEFRQRYLGDMSLFGPETEGGIMFERPLYRSSRPNSVDWRLNGWVSDVKKNQEPCMSCWAFAATGAIEGQYAKKTGQLVSLSEQQLMDCLSGSCWIGGRSDSAYNYIKTNGGINLDTYYPYEAKTGTCRYNPSHPKVQVRGHVNIPPRDREALLDAIAFVGPIKVSLIADNSFRHFSGDGIYDEPNFNSPMFHAVLAIGYGTEAGRPYYLIKNSWGKTWGNGGYGKISRETNRDSAITGRPNYPLV